MRNQGWLAVLSAAVLAGCAGGAGSGAGLPAVTASSGQRHAANATRTDPGSGPAHSGEWGQVVHALPNTLNLNGCIAQSGTFDAEENFSGDITATVADPTVASVTTATVHNHVDPTDGGLKHAWFTVVPHAAGTTTVFVADKKGNADFVTVTVVGCPTPPPTAPPTPTAFGGGTW